MGGREVVLLFECADRQQILICRSPPWFFFLSLFCGYRLLMLWVSSSLSSDNLFRILGLCNNFSYVVMLSAAHDILKKQESQQNATQTVRKATFKLKVFFYARKEMIDPCFCVSV